MIVDGNKSYNQQREDFFNIISDFNMVSSQIWKVLDYNSMDSTGLHIFQKLLYTGTRKIQACKTIVNINIKQGNIGNAAALRLLCSKRQIFIFLWQTKIAI